MATPHPLPFGAVLRRHRVLSGLTQEALAERAGLSVRAISDLERGVNRTPQPGTLDLLAKALQLSAEERDSFEAAARWEKLQKQPDPTPLAPASFTARPDDPPAKPSTTSDEPEEPARLPGNETLDTTRAEQHNWQESAPPQKLRPLSARRPSPSLVLGLTALLVFVAASSGLGYWLKLGPFDKDAATSATPAPAYVYAQPTHRGGTITVSEVGFPYSLGIWTATDDLVTALWGFPFAVSPTGKFLPDELKEIPTQANGDVSKDGLTVTMRLRPDLMWSDEQPLTADDFAYWMEVAQDPASTGIEYFIPPEYQQIAYQVLDAHTLVLHYKQLLVSYLFFLPQAAPRHVWGSIPHKDLFSRDDVRFYPAVTSGPFKLASSVPGQSMTLVPNRHYFSTTLHRSVLDTLIFRAYSDQDALLADFRAGKLNFAYNLTVDGFPQLSTQPGIHISTSHFYSQLNFNLSNPVLQDEQVRKAIEEAIDRCSMIEMLFQYSCATLRFDTILSPPSLAYDPTITAFGFDLAQARKDMQAAGWDCSSGTCMKDGQPFPLLHLVLNSGFMVRWQTAELIKQNLAELGIPVSVSSYNGSVLFADYNSGGILATGQYDLAVVAVGDYLDPDLDLYSFLHSSQIPSVSNPWGGNYSRVNDPVVDNLLDQGRMTLNLAARTQVYKDLQLEVVKHIYLVPLYLLPIPLLVNSAIGNEQDNPTSGGNLWNVGDWFLTQ